jgi:serine/threonine protein kinase/Flp pilus assembly protein TadD
MSADAKKARDIFVVAVKMLPDQWEAYLEEACAGDEDLRRRVEELLEAHRKAGSFLASPAAPAATIDESRIAEGPGAAIGPYKLLEQIGEGGFGVVFMAEQQQPVRRKVALKVLKPGMDTRQVIARFEAERQALALMDHPNIAKVLDAGETASGRPYFVMELVKGVPITHYCDQGHLTPRQRLQLFGAVCQAVQHAHQKGIIHRDLKPSNVLVTLQDGQPSVKVIDFGIAKATGGQLTDKTLLTGFAQMIGTPLYMSPEQAGLSVDIDTRSDIYSLGVLLYELLTGTTPFSQERFQQAGFDEIRRIIREEEPPKPSTRLSESKDSLPSVSAQRHMEPAKLTKLVRGELDWIVMRCLEKERNRRYETANGLAMDVQRYLADEPVVACPPSAVYRLRKFAQRNKPALLTSAIVSAALLFAVGAVGWAVRDREARREEATKQESARRATFEEEIRRALEESEDWYKRDELPEALAAVKRAEGLLATGGGSEHVRQRVRQWRADLNMVRRLEDIRLEMTSVNQWEAFDSPAASNAYHEAFQQYGVNLRVLSPDEAGDLIRRSAVRDRLVAALDAWVEIYAPADFRGTERLLNVGRRADADPWRDRLREALLLKEFPALECLARDKELMAQPPATLLFLATALRKAEHSTLAVEVLREAQQRRPDDFWINHQLAFYLHHDTRPPRCDEAIGFYRGALAIRPQSAGVHLNLGQVFFDKGMWHEAIAAFRQAIHLKPDYATAHNDLGASLSETGLYDEAVGAFREAIRLKPKLAVAHHGLGITLERQGKWQGAVDSYHHAIKLEPTFAEANCSLGKALMGRGRFAEALSFLKKGHELGSKRPDWSRPSAQWLAHCERQLQLDEMVPAILKGEVKPKEVGEQFEFAHACARKRFFAVAARLNQEALTGRPQLPRYFAAGYAALAGWGKGEDAAQLDDSERAQWRQQALNWLTEDLTDRKKLVESDEPAVRAFGQKRLKEIVDHWLANPDLAALRERQALDQLPEAERDGWRRLWAELEALVPKEDGKIDR